MRDPISRVGASAREVARRQAWSRIAAAAALALGAAMVVAPPAAVASVEVASATSADGCSLVEATMSWGFKETFRAYIDGSIANGSWEVSDGATYSTPLFSWSGGTGTYDPVEHSGRISFTGTVVFTGHDGLLQTTIANPVIEFIDENSAVVMLDVSGVSMEEALSGDTSNPRVATGIPFVDVDLAGGDLMPADDGVGLAAANMPTTLTAEGYAAFPNYEAGTAFDPLSFTLTLPNDCDLSGVPSPHATAGPGGGPPEGASPPGWVVAVGAGVSVLVIAMVVALYLWRRRSA